MLHMLAWAALFFYFYAMAKTREVFICSACGAQTLQWRGQCPGCHEWNTLQAAAQPKALSRSNTRVSVPAGNRPVPLQDVAETGHHPYPSGIASLDRVLGKGLVPGAAILIGGEPGIGKSTLLLQVAGLVAAQGGRVLYASGEESLPQIKARGQRLGMLHDNLLAMSTSSVDEVIAALELAPPRLLVVDSVQTMSSVDAEGLPGNVNQVRAVSMALLEACRRLGVTLVLVGHVTKDGVLAGPRLLEHMVDTVLYFEGDKNLSYRILRANKNRFGSTNEIGVFEMGQNGLREVPNPSEALLSGRPLDCSGSCITCLMEGTRPILVEIQALVTKTSFGNPRRVATGFDMNRTAMLLAVLEKRAGFYMGNLDVFVNAAGGMRADEPSADLAVAMAVLSNLLDKVIPDDMLLLGEIGLAGEIRSTPQVQQRVGEGYRLGFRRFLLPKSSMKTMNAADYPEAEFLPVGQLSEAVRLLRN